MSRLDAFDALLAEAERVLRPGGVFLAQRVGGSHNLDRFLVEATR